MMAKDNSVYLAWQASDTRDWHIVGLLTENTDKSYTFNYTKGTEVLPNFAPFSGMPDITKKYISKDLFPQFKNRVLNKKRPEYPCFIKWLGLDDDESSPVTILARSGGLRGTDQLQMFNRIEFNPDGSFEHIFFAHGLSHLTASANQRVMDLECGEKLYLCPDPQNKYDENAVLIRAENPTQVVGYCPRYLAADILLFLNQDTKSINIVVEALSDTAPANYKLMCKISGKVDSQLVNEVMNNEEFQLLSEL